MHIYTMSQWLILFFIYCVAGWIWESCYVSLKQKKWVNRGFLHGPWLPIYGSGAIIILFTTLPVKDNLWLIWLFGMISATVLEYFTGAAIEKIFKVRYWDYTSHRFQLKGYICLSSSIAWGFFSILLIRVIHPPLARLLADIPDVFIDPLSLVLVVLFMIDTVQSVHEAISLRDMITKLTEENEDLRRLAKRAEVVAAFAEEDLNNFRAKTEFNKLLAELCLKEDFDEYAERRINNREKLENRIRKAVSIRLETLDQISDVLTTHKYDFDRLSGDAKGHTGDSSDDFREAMEMISDYRSKIRSRELKAYRNMLRIIRANPSFNAVGYDEVMDMLRQLGK